MRVLAYFLLLFCATGSALLRGTKGERWIGATVLAGNLLSFFLEHMLSSSFGSVSLIYLILDAGLAIMLCFIAVRYPSWVAILVSAFQINGTLGHIVKLVAPHTIPFSYAFLLKFWAWLMVAAMLTGRAIPQLHRILTSRTFVPAPISVRSSWDARKSNRNGPATIRNSAGDNL